jgi:uncharacterized protein with PQ loop repeat
MALFIEPWLFGEWSGMLWILTTITSAVLLLTLLTTLIFFKRENNRNIRIMLISVLPALCLWTLNFAFVYVFEILSGRYNNKPCIAWHFKSPK